MRKLYILLCLLLASCIHNDIPYPYIKGEVLTFEAKGQKEVTINKETRTITLVLDENTDPRAVQITKLELTEEATSTLDTTQPIDMTKQVTFTVETYQQYEWKIEITQPIECRIRVENQVGEATIDLAAKTIQVYVAKTQSLSNITVKEFKIAPSTATYTPNPLTITNFSKPMVITTSCWGVSQEWAVSFLQSDVTVYTLEANAWGKFAYLNGSILAGTADTPSFEYHEQSSQEWLPVAATVNGASISAKLTGLTQQTTYVYRARLGDETGSEVTFTTDDTPDIPNMNMDTWTQKGKNWYANDVAEDTFWGTGNEGASISLAAGKSTTTPTEDSHSGKAARLESLSAGLVGMAAGNLFTGSFDLQMPPHALDSPGFSQPYTGRPTSMSFWYKYSPKPIDSKASKDDPDKGKMDKCTIYIILGNWEGQLKSSKIDGMNTEGAIAYGVFKSDKEVTQYTQQTIQIEYKDLTTRPTRMMIVTSASARGEEYIGGIGSTLFLDDFEFGWN